MPIPTFVSGNVLTAAQLNTITAALPIVDGWTSWTPQIDQGGTTNIAKTNVYSKYTKVGRWVNASFDLTLTAGGTAGAAIKVSLPPFTPAATSQPVGTGFLVDASVPLVYPFHAIVESTTRIVFWASAGGGGVESGLGVDTFTLALASGDQIRCTFRYEATT